MKTDQKSSKIDHKIFCFVLVFIKKWKIFCKKILKKFRKKVSQKKFFLVLKNALKSSQHKKQKKTFLGQIDLQFLCVSQISLFSMIFWLAPVDREMLSGHLGVSIKKICWGEHLHFKAKNVLAWTLGKQWVSRI